MPKNEVVIDIGKEFSRFPAGRTPRDGRYNGETFREKLLRDNLRNKRRVVIQFDNALSYGSSFLEEAFAGLVREYNHSTDTLRSLLELRSSDPFLIDEIWSYIKDASAGRKRV